MTRRSAVTTVTSERCTFDRALGDRAKPLRTKGLIQPNELTVGNVTDRREVMTHIRCVVADWSARAGNKEGGRHAACVEGACRSNIRELSAGARRRGPMFGERARRRQKPTG